MTGIKIHSLLHEAFAAAVRWGIIVRNPAASADPPKAKGRRHLTTWTADELARFLDHLEAHDDQCAAPLRLAALTGLRRGELLGLAWDDVDLDGHKLTVQSQLLVIDGEMVLSKDTKSHRKRPIDLDAETVAVLRRYRARQAAQRLAVGAGYRDTGLVFTHCDGSPINPHPFSMAFKRRARAAGVPVIRLHDLRHSHISMLVKAGRVKVAVERAGHAKAAFTMQVYAHLAPTEQAEAAEEIAALVDGARAAANG